MVNDLPGLLRERILILDGAMGTMLQQNGMNPGCCPELYGIEHEEVLFDIHKQYREAGADIIQTNTFGGSRFKLAEYGLADRVTEINAAAVSIARRAAAPHGLVAASIGPTGKLLRPMGDVTFDDLYAAFAEQMIACAQAGADLISIETMTDIGEMRAALIAAQQNTRLPVIAHMTFEDGGRTMTGTDPVTAVIIMEALQPLAIGANCSGGARELLPVIQEMSRHTRLCISVEPNAGLPFLVEGQTVFPDTPEEMAEYALRLKEAGANIIGGCCGTTPVHIQAIARALKGLAPSAKTAHTYPALASRSHYVMIGSDQPLAFIGERINPTARKKLAQDIKDGHMQIVVDEARKQVECGAPVLDVNMGVPGIDEVQAMHKAVTMIQDALDIPIAIDSTNPEAVEEGLKNFVGRPLINSTTGEDKNLDIILPLAKKYGAAVLGLCIGDEGIPDRAEERLQVARKIYQRALEYGLRKEDIFIDCLVKTASAQQEQVMETIQAVKMVKEDLGVGTVLGVSNVSHGLPARDILNSAYLTMAWAAGLDLPIMNPFEERMMAANRAVAVLLNRDANSTKYIENYRDYKVDDKPKIRHPLCEKCNIPDLVSAEINITGTSGVSRSAETISESDDTTKEKIKQAILRGEKENISVLIEAALQEGQLKPLDIVNQAMIPGIEEAGEMYDKKRYFLPQLMMAAETMKRAFAIIKPLLTVEGQTNTGVIVLATVEGDIHDIGKNIVAVLLENYGFKVVDLGKDVPTAVILERAAQEDADIIGLSALMTTTMPRMQEIVDGVKERGLRARVMVGGAVLNQEYADQIGADAYSEDARSAVLTAQRLLGIFQ
ncbi:5-methyltetrahydrofolate-homocysteine S-methyltransferase, bacterial [Syntrophomonas zehnderi OL-4]|uniref:Methionine synthase n=1 Tax=Syntrophomonas zehnderi OL-4 TaxID=690567 RepID=A0A0E4GBP3_9FIRM|nr:homocysteine S-methyltransferase family protein [Syntrophomonas zehnderi]CFX95025.1 5-methyltetrahydrofolate-homocysteine S-methyltransferase, bacterial [Syntrophomonas zehnderi OL-4]